MRRSASEVWREWRCRGLPRTTLAFALLLAAALPTLASDDFVAANYTKREVMIPMRDGARLYTQVYEPRDGSREYGIILERTAYGVGSYGDEAHKNVLGPNSYYARAGFIFVYQEIRGTFLSEGEFVVHRPYHPDKRSKADVDESSDTYDTIEWLLENVPGHNGKVVAWGTSYSGWLAVMSLLDPHPAVAGVFAQAPPIDMWRGDDFHHNGAFRLMYAFDWTGSHARARTQRTTEAHAPFDYGTPDGYRFFLELGPLRNADARYFKGTVPTWNEFMEHGDYDAYWQARNPLKYLKSLDIPVLVVAGWFDGEDFYGPMSLYRTIRKRFPESDCRLVVGPWRHSGWNWMEGDELGELRFGSPTAARFRKTVEFPFFAHHLSDEESLDLPRALVFETGGNAWASFDEWPPPGTTERRLYLREDGKLESAPATGTARDSFTSDPARPVPWSAEIRATQGHRGLYEDQRFAASRPDVLVYESEVLQEDLTIAGPVTVVLHVSTTGTDADWVVKLIDVFPGDAPDNEPNHCGARMGHHQMLVTAEVLRSKYRSSLSTPEPLTPGAVTEIEFELPDRYHRFLAGHRIMVQVQSSWFPVVDRNPQSFTDIYAANETDFRSAVHSVYLAGEHASQIRLPMLEDASLAAPDDVAGPSQEEVERCLLDRRHGECVAMIRAGNATGRFYFLLPLRGELEQVEGFEEVFAENERLRRAAIESATSTVDVVLPADFDAERTYPLLVILHGGNSTAEIARRNWDCPRLRREFVVAFVQSYLHYGMHTFGWAQADPRARRDIRRLIEETASEYPVDPRRILVGGISAGGETAIDVVVNRVVPAAGFVGICPGKPKELARADVAAARDRGVRGFIVSGDGDFYLGEQTQMVSLFEDVGLQNRFHVLPGMGHEYPSDFCDWVEASLDFVLDEEPSREN